MNKRGQASTILFILIFLIFIVWPVVNYFSGIGCKTEALLSKDKYCVDASNTTYGHSWIIRSHEQDRIDNLHRLEKKRLAEERKVAEQKCYNSGYFVNESFEVSDYFTCKQVAYLNDHLMDNYERVSGGYVYGRYSGLISHGYLSGELYQYINDRVLASV